MALIIVREKHYFSLNTRLTGQENNRNTCCSTAIQQRKSNKIQVSDKIICASTRPQRQCAINSVAYKYMDNASDDEY